MPAVMPCPNLPDGPVSAVVEPSTMGPVFGTSTAKHEAVAMRLITNVDKPTMNGLDVRSQDLSAQIHSGISHLPIAGFGARLAAHNPHRQPLETYFRVGESQPWR